MISHPWMETIFGTLVVAVGVVGSWMLGGRAQSAPVAIGTLGWLAFAWYVVATVLRHTEARRFAEYQRRRREKVALPLGEMLRRMARAWPAWLLCAGMGISLLNPSFEMVSFEDGKRVLRAIDHITWLPATVDPLRSGPMVFMFSGLCAMAIAAGIAPMSRRVLRGIAIALMINAVILAIAGTLFKLTGSDLLLGRFKPVGHYFFASFYYKNHWTAFALLHIGLAIGLARSALRTASDDRQAPARAMLALTTVFLLALTIPMSESRGGMILLVPLLLVFFLSFLGDLGKHGRRIARLRTPVAVAGALTAVLLVVLALPEIQKRWHDTLRQIERAEGELLMTDGIRMRESPAVTTAMALERPVFGWGYYSYFRVFPAFAPDSFKRKDGSLAMTLEYAHNDWLQMWAEIGSVGMALLLLWVGGYFWKTRPLGSTSHLARWSTAGLIAVALFAAWDFPFSNPAVLAHALIIGTIAGRIARRAAE